MTVLAKVGFGVKRTNSNLQVRILFDYQDTGISMFLVFLKYHLFLTYSICLMKAIAPGIYITLYGLVCAYQTEVGKTSINKQWCNKLFQYLYKHAKYVVQIFDVNMY